MRYRSGLLGYVLEKSCQTKTLIKSVHFLALTVIFSPTNKDFLDTLEDQNNTEQSSPHPRPASTTCKYLNNELSHPTLLRSPPSVSFSTVALAHGHHLSLSSSHLPSLPHLTTGISSAGVFPLSVAFSLSSPLHHLSAASFHSSALNCLPDKKQKATVEKAVDIVKEKKKKVVDTLTKVHVLQLSCPTKVTW